MGIWINCCLCGEGIWYQHFYDPFSISVQTLENFQINNSNMFFPLHYFTCLHGWVNKVWLYSWHGSEAMKIHYSLFISIWKSQHQKSHRNRSKGLPFINDVGPWASKSKSNKKHMGPLVTSVLTLDSVGENNRRGDMILMLSCLLLKDFILFHLGIYFPSKNMEEGNAKSYHWPLRLFCLWFSKH